MKKLVLIFSLITTLGIMLQGQSTRKLFLGIQPDLTREIKNNDEKAFSVNVLPMAAQVYLNENTGIRISSILNLRNTTRSISHVGGQLRGGGPFYWSSN